MEKFLSQERYRITIPFVDLIIIYGSVILSYILLHDSLEAPVDNWLAFENIALYMGIFYLITQHVFEFDKPKEFTLFGVGYTAALIVFCLVCSTMAICFLIREFAYPRSILILSSVMQFGLLVLWHLLTNKIYRNINRKKSVLIIGYERTQPFAYKLIEEKGIWSDIKHICKPECEDVAKFINECDITFITEDVDEIKKQDIVRYCVENNRNVMYEPRNSELLLFNSNLVQIDDMPLLDVKQLRIQTIGETTKRALDVLLGLAGAIVFILPISIIYLCLKAGGGSAFFVQERVTRGGRIFKIYKFRTMIENAEAMSGPVLAGETDPRITKLGHILRATRLDETPQIFNVLKGDMSIVGPRPERPFFVEQFKEEIPEYDLRHRVKAGLTGIAQVQGKYNTSARDKLKYDLIYINGYSFALDIKLIMQTLNILLKKSSTEGVKDICAINEHVEKLYRD